MKRLLIVLLMVILIGANMVPQSVDAVTVQMNKKTLVLQVGGTENLKVTGTINSVKWITSNKAIATVSTKGKVKAIAPGNVTITAIVSKNKYNCNVTVNGDLEVNNVTNSKTAKEVVVDMGHGWNLGNTMEAVANWLKADATVEDYEKAWGQPKTTKAMIDGLKESGIKTIRIPVAWSNMMSKDGNYTISDSYFKRVDEIVGYVLDNNMYAILNIHWDGGWWEDFASLDEIQRKNAMLKYQAMWTQITNHYKDYSDYLIFESANEELGGSFKKHLSEDDSYKKCNEINQKFVDIVRNSGGNNKDRYLLIAGYNTDIQATCDNRFVMPKDIIKNRLMISVHYYTPSTFCIANSKDNSWGYMDRWGSDKEIAEMRTNFVKMKKFTNAGYGVIIGEYGVTLKKENGSEVVKEGTDKFIKTVNELSAEMGYCAMLWDGSTWYNRKTCKFNYDTIAEVFKH